jgi:NAD(P)-dependent dehydrogenase (short-subunit alcohol dehydrogenase family)
MARVVVISGGTQGLGAAVARRVARDGDASFVLVGRTEVLGTSLAHELTATGSPSIFVAADIAEDGAPQHVIDAAVARFGSVTSVVNVAATTSRATLLEDTPAHFDHQMAVNVRAPYFLIQAAVQVMVDQQIAGSIVNVGSTSGYGGQSKLSAYSISKGALTVLTKNLAFALMHNRIRVNQVNPGWMDTPSEDVTQRTRDGAPPDWLVSASAGRPWGRLVSPVEVANVIALCLSDESGLMSGAIIDVDQSVQGAGDPPIPGPRERLES